MSRNSCSWCDSCGIKRGEGVLVLGERQSLNNLWERSRPLTLQENYRGSVLGLRLRGKLLAQEALGSYHAQRSGQN